MASNSWRARSLKAALRAAIEQSGVSRRDVAEQLQVSHTTMNRWLADNEPAPDAEKTALILARINTASDVRERILALARTPDVDWLVSGPPGINPQLAAVLEFERYATHITEWQPLIWPGLLQSSAYARAVFADSGMGGTEIETNVMMRIARREALTRRKPIEFTALVGLPAVHGGIGGVEVTAEQLSHVREVTKLRNVTIQVVDLGGPRWYPGHVGAFILYEFEEMPPAVYIEHYRSGAVIGDAADVADYKTAAETLRRAAMSPEQSVGLIAGGIPNSMEKTT